MAFSIKITDRAYDDIDEAMSFISEDSPDAARKWKTRLEALIYSLQEMPTRFPVIPEADELGLPYRGVVHFSHRVIFRVDEDVVYIVRVYHGMRHALKRADVEPSGEN